MLSIRLPEEIETRLTNLAEQTGRPKSYYAREAILEYLDDLEDIYLAQKRLEDIRAGRSKTIPLEEVAKELGLLPKTENEIRQILRKEMPLLKTRYSVESLELFGSYVRGEQGEDSDIDILVTYKNTPSLFGHVGLENYLSDLLGTKVDLVMKSSLKKHIGERILSEAVSV